MKKKHNKALISACLEGYAAAARLPAVPPVDTNAPQRDLRKFLGQLSSVHPQAFLKARITGKGNRRRLRILKDKTLPASAREIRRLRRWWKQQSDHPEIAPFGKLLDVARRVTGTGSLGLRRYVLLVANDDGAHLLELKQAAPAAMIRQHRAPANPWRSEAERVTRVQRRAQRTPPLLLETVTIGKHDYILRELHPGDDKLTVAAGQAQILRLRRLAPWLGRVAAASHRHTTGWMGASTGKEIAAFAEGTAWRRQVASYAIAYKKIVERDWAQFKRARSHLTADEAGAGLR